MIFGGVPRIFDVSGRIDRLRCNYSSDRTSPRALLSSKNRPEILFDSQTICLGRVSPVQVWYAMTVQLNPDVTYR